MVKRILCNILRENPVRDPLIRLGSKRLVQVIGTAVDRLISILPISFCPSLLSAVEALSPTLVHLPVHLDACTRANIFIDSARILEIVQCSELCLLMS